ncbi:MAG: hypothetical protein WKF42_07440 [Solirubrobacteraceae bacterium]
MTVPQEPLPQQTWNDARAIAEHRRMSAAECVMAEIALSRALHLTFAGEPATSTSSRPRDLVDLAELDAIHGPQD